jgi:tight adherence protein C
LTFLSVVALGGSLLAARSARRSVIQTRMGQILGPLPTAADATAQPAQPGLLSRIGRVFLPANPTQRLREELARAGYHSDSAPARYIGLKMLLFFAGLIVLAPILTLTALGPVKLAMGPTQRLILLFCGAAALSFVPNMVVHAKRQRRRRRIENHLADAIDLLEICVSAGMALDMAWNAVADNIRSVCPELADEMALTNLEIHLGAGNANALRHMAQRTGVQEVASLTATIIQSERFGTSISETLRVFATALRETRSQKVQEAAEKLTVKLIFPLVFLVFPAVVIVMAGPAVMKLMWSLH